MSPCFNSAFVFVVFIRTPTPTSDPCLTFWRSGIPTDKDTLLLASSLFVTFDVFCTNSSGELRFDFTFSISLLLVTFSFIFWLPREPFIELALSLTRLLDELELVDDEILRLLPPSPVLLFVVDLDELLELFEELEDEELDFFDLSLDDTDPEELLLELLLLVVDVERTEDGELTDESDNTITSSDFGAFQGLTSFVVVGVVTFGVVGVGDEEDL